MIIQCEQCKTKFRLDEEKIKGRGVKVRCSKCRHVFLVQKEERPEVPTFDGLLGQYGGAGAALGGGVESVPASPAVGLPADTPAIGVPSGTTDVIETSKGREDEGVFASLQLPAEGEELAVMPAFDADNGGFDSDSGDQPDSFSLPDEPAGFEFAHGLDGANLSQEPASPDAGGVGALVEQSGDASFDMSRQPNAAGESAEEEFSIDFGELSSSEEPGADNLSGPDDKTPGRDEFNLDFDDVFGETPPPSDSASSSVAAIPDEGLFPGLTPSGDKGGDDLGGLDFGELDLGGATLSGATTGEVAQDHEIFPRADVSMPAPATAPPLAAPLAADGSEELPPLTISSRRKGASFFPAAITIIAIFFVVVLAGVGFFVVSGPETMKRMGLGFLTSLTGGAAEEGKISLGKVSAEFVTNNEAGELFVIRGETVNNYSKPRASIQVKATLLAANGQPILHKLAYCGNSLTKDQLTMLSMNKLEEVMNNQFGDSLSNMGVQPGKSIPFVVVFAAVPREAADFTVSVAGSTVAAK